MEKFDFSKIEDQKKFDNLPEKEREDVINKSHEDAARIKEKIEFGEAKDYGEAEKLVDRDNNEIEELASFYRELPESYNYYEMREKLLSFSQKAIKGFVTSKIISSLLNGKVEYAWDIVRDFEEGHTRYAVGWRSWSIFPRGTFQAAEGVQKVAKIALIKSLSRGEINNALLAERFSPSLKEIITNPDLEVQQAAKDGFMENLIYKQFDDADRIKDKFSLPAEIILEAAKDASIRCLSYGNIDNFIKITKKFGVSFSPSEIVSQIPKLKNLLNQLKQISPQFYDHAHKSFDTIITLLEFTDNPDKFLKEIKEKPFLADAVMENPKFGSKLLVKFPQFDDLSKQNIRTLFDAKKDILKENREIDPESLEFRKLIQERLKKYENNPEILAKMEKSGINIDQWLNYQNTSYFSLESGKSNLAFSETIVTPINRIKETIDSYAHQIKEILKEYKKELSEYQISVENPQEVQNKIAQMREGMEKAKTEGNDRKAQGIQKGIDGLTQKLANLKTVSIWDKVLGGINSFDQLKNDVSGAQEKLIQAESELAEKTSGKTPSGKEIQDAKQRIAKAKEELRSKFGLLENRIESFKGNLSETIEPALGKERTGSLTHEIETGLAEQFDHYDADRSELANLFSERGDKDKDKMESLPMSVFVWARNPDIDLYQGNYSDCCIKINSEHMGAESTIADYNTDLGMQIVNICDEAKNEPITAAWCWTGKDGKGEKALVVDNIESNTLYSSNYPEQLTKELFDYLKDYAKAIGVKKVVLGKANNDLPTGGELAKLADDDGRYEKIGGYNRTDGYFLEAEDKSVKIIWEAKQKESKGKAKEKNKTTAIEFTEINAKDLSKDDFETIKKMERKIYRGTDLIQGQAMIEDIKSAKGLDYSTILYGKNAKTGKMEAVGYIVAVEDETDEGDESIYLEDIALLPEAQGQRLGLNLLKSFVEKLKAKAVKENKPILLDMHLRENSQRFIGRNRQALEQMGVKLIEEALVADYYGEGEDALYQVYEVKGA